MAKPRMVRPQYTTSKGTARWRSCRSALFEPAADLADRIRAAGAAIGLTDLGVIRMEEIAEQDWVRLTQSQFEPIRINDKLWIVPSWHVAPDAQAINLVLDPGLAFVWARRQCSGSILMTTP